MKSACSEDFKTVLDFNFDQVEAEILGLDHTKGHFSFLHFLQEITQKNDLKLHRNVKTENDPWCLLTPISQLLLGQN